MSLTDIVLQVLRNHPTTRCDDRRCLVDVYKALGLSLSPEQERFFMTTASPWSVLRLKKRIQQGGRFKT